MPVYPPNEHVYRFSLEPGKYEPPGYADQLIHALEDALGLRLSGYEGQELPDGGWATLDLGVNELHLRAFSPMSNACLGVVEQVIAAHAPVMPMYGGHFSSVATRYRMSIGQVIVVRDNAPEASVDTQNRPVVDT